MVKCLKCVNYWTQIEKQYSTNVMRMLIVCRKFLETRFMKVLKGLFQYQGFFIEVEKSKWTQPLPLETKELIHNKHKLWKILLKQKVPRFNLNIKL